MASPIRPQSNLPMPFFLASHLPDGLSNTEIPKGLVWGDLDSQAWTWHISMIVQSRSQCWTNAHLLQQSHSSSHISDWRMNLCLWAPLQVPKLRTSSTALWMCFSLPPSPAATQSLMKALRADWDKSRPQNPGFAKSPSLSPEVSWSESDAYISGTSGARRAQSATGELPLPPVQKELLSHAGWALSL